MTKKAVKTQKADLLMKDLKWLTPTSKTKFSYLAGINRAIIPYHVTKLAKSLEKMGVLRPVIVAELDFISGKKELCILDGQHLFNGLLRLGWNIPYIVVPIKNKQELIENIALLNSSSKSWTLLDYVNSWGSLKEDYIKLNKYFNIYDMEISFLAGILGGCSIASGGHAGRIIKSGEFQIVNEEQNVKLIDYLTELLSVIPRMDRARNRYVCSEYINFVKSNPKYDHKKFITKAKKNKDKFFLATQEEGKLSEMFYKMA